MNNYAVTQLRKKQMHGENQRLGPELPLSFDALSLQ